MKRIIFTFVILTFIFSQSFAETSFLECTLAKQKTKNGAMLVDVRTKPEFSSGTLDGSINIPLEDMEKSLKGFPDDKSKEIIVFCRSGRRSEIAKNLLIKAGYKNVYNAGGYSTLNKCWQNK